MEPRIPSGLRPEDAAHGLTTPSPQVTTSGLARALPLQVLAEADLVSLADLAVFAKIPTSTLGRLWSDPAWLDKVSGATLQRLITAVPGLARYVACRSHAARLETAVHQCTESGLEVHGARVVELVRAGQSPQYLATVLEAAAAVARLDARDTVAALSRCWSAGPSAALDAVFTPGGVLADPDLLAGRATQLLDLVDTRGNSMAATVGYGILVHKLTRLTGTIPGDGGSPAGDRCAAFAYRSGVIGVLLGAGDHDAAESYARQVAASALLARNELWSLASFCTDIPLTAQMTTSTRDGLRRTATEVIGDVVSLNDAYLHYLLTTAIPVLLAHDASFGGARTELGHALAGRLEAGIDEPHTREAGARLLKTVQ
ncbi:hypothetical protein JK358_37390 [Nocardia sp. 2]|uniref:Transcriptional regulator n=1 Tax=Nocardia acididurans TaxID=2802282 RepID=A0ABS1MHJ1_9NOCA|nr:hypothetical protein [Nocardia acididurans]MBL1080087.1 hypothetical protein [Nocardia acididurans]